MPGFQSYVLYDFLEEGNLYVQKTGQWLPEAGGEGGVIDYKGAKGNIWGWMNCSIFWLWVWLHDYRHLEEVTKLCTKKGKF